jgi:hypothetical protein
MIGNGPGFISFDGPWSRRDACQDLSVNIWVGIIHFNLFASNARFGAAALLGVGYWGFLLRVDRGTTLAGNGGRFISGVPLSLITPKDQKSFQV